MKKKTENSPNNKNGKNRSLVADDIAYLLLLLDYNIQMKVLLQSAFEDSRHRILKPRLRLKGYFPKFTIRRKLLTLFRE